MKKILTLLVPLLLTALAARADVIWQELFNYADGQITNTSGGLWILQGGTAGVFDGYVYKHRLEVSTTGTSGNGINGLAPSRAEDVHRLLAVTAGSPYTNAVSTPLLFSSFIINFTNTPSPNGAYFAHFGNNTTGFEGKLWALTGNPLGTSNVFSALPNTFRLGVSNFGSGSPSKIYNMDLAFNTDYQVVLQWDQAGAFVTLWINPISSSDPSVAGIDVGTVFTSLAFDFRQATGFGGFTTISNLVLATTFNEAAQNVVAPVGVPPTIVYQPAANTTNFVGDTASLSAVVNGQGQGSLTYQWQKSTDNVSFAPYTNPLGNTNVVQFDTTTIGDFYYRLVVTTPAPYSQSATSSSAHVRINAPVGPPSFVVQPVSNNGYTGQNVTFTTTVLSPGTPVYTWYSNNVVVTGGQVDSGSSSSFTIPNVQPGTSTWKVAVTNETVSTGIVSTNAVLTVNNAPVVSIAYLRTLLDPSTYQATNSTTPYQITGTITTYTNITSGNTLSYYLQDATAGINIFATFGQTFRPNQGDTVTFIGLMSNFSSGLELAANTVDSPFTSYSDSGAGTLPAPLAIPFTYTNTGYANVNSNLAGRYVQLSGVYFPTNAGTIVTNGFISVTNYLGQRTYLWFSAVDLDTQQALPAYASTVTGVVFGSMNSGNPNFAVAVTKFSDIVAATPPVLLYASYGGGNVTITWGDPTFSLQGATSVAGPWSTLTGSNPYVYSAATGDPQLGGAANGFYRLIK